MKHLTILMSLLLLGGCSSLGRIFSPKSTNVVTDVTKAIHPSESLTVLSTIGGLCLLAGMVLLVISRGTKGWIPCIGGVILVLLNYAVAEYAHWIFIPMLIATGCISAVWGWKVIKKILNHKGIKRG